MTIRALKDSHTFSDKRQADQGPHSLQGFFPLSLLVILVSKAEHHHQLHKKYFPLYDESTCSSSKLSSFLPRCTVEFILYWLAGYQKSECVCVKLSCQNVVYFTGQTTITRYHSAFCSITLWQEFLILINYLIA